MRLSVVGAVGLIVIATAASAADTPQQLLLRLTQAAHNRDLQGFVANLSAPSRAELARETAAGNELSQARARFEAALDAHFGGGRPPSFPPPDRASVLARFVSLELLNLREQGLNRAQLEIRTLSRDHKGRQVSEEDSFAAVRERGQWRLDLLSLLRGSRQITAARTAVFSEATKEVYQGTSKDRLSAMIAVAEGERGIIGRPR